MPKGPLGHRKQSILNYRVPDLVLGPGKDGKTIFADGATERGELSRFACQGIADISLGRNRVSDRVTSELNVNSAVTSAELIGHATRKRARPTKAVVL